MSVEIEYSGSFEHPVTYVDECVKNPMIIFKSYSIGGKRYA